MPVTTKWEERAKSSEHNFNIEHDKVVKLELENQRLIEIMEKIAMELHDQIKKKLQKALEE